MASPLPVLNNVRVASPCSQAWDEMKGDDRSRFCTSCDRHVYNLSGMPQAEAEALVREREGRLCVRFYRRRDGSLLTADCPVGRQRMRRALIWQCGAVTMLFAAFPALAAVAHATKWRDWAIWRSEPLEPLAVRLGIVSYPIMGVVAMPTPPPGP
jgi:hypothetical protein